MSGIVLGPGRDEELGITNETISKRKKKIEDVLDPSIHEIAVYLAEGQGMMYGTAFESGAELAIYLSESIKFAITVLMEKGKLPKTLPKQKKDKNDKDEGVGQYL